MRNRNRIRIAVAVISSIFVLTQMLGLTPAYAVSGAPECASFGTGQCIYKGSNTIGFALTMANDNPGASENILRPLSSVCGGIVTSGCPFNGNLGAPYVGDNIVTLQFGDGAGCVGFVSATGAAEGVLQNCSGTHAFGTVIVSDPNGTALQFIDVRLTNDNNSVHCLVSTGAGGELVAEHTSGCTNWQHP